MQEVLGNYWVFFREQLSKPAPSADVLEELEAQWDKIGKAYPVLKPYCHKLMSKMDVCQLRGAWCKLIHALKNLVFWDNNWRGEQVPKLKRAFADYLEEGNVRARAAKRWRVV